MFYIIYFCTQGLDIPRIPHKTARGGGTEMEEDIWMVFYRPASIPLTLHNIKVCDLEHEHEYV